MPRIIKQAVITAMGQSLILSIFMAASQVEELTPRVWKTKFADNFLTSDLAL